MTGFVLALLALLAGPVVWALSSYPLSQGPPIVLAVLAVVLVLIALPLAVLGYRRARRGTADARGLALTGLVLAAAVPLVLVGQVAASRVAFTADARALCSALAGQYQSEVALSALDDASPGAGWPTQVARAQDMTRTYCPDATSLISRAGSLLTGGY